MPIDSPPLPVSHSPPLFFWIGGAAAAVAVGWVGAKLNASGAAPIGLLPLGLGIALGVALIAIASKTHVNCKKRLATASLALAILLVVAEHAWLYRDYRQQWWNDAVREPRLAIFRTETSPLLPADYYAREIEHAPNRLALWALDAALIVAATLSTVLIANHNSQRPQPPVLNS